MLRTVYRTARPAPALLACSIIPAREVVGDPPGDPRERGAVVGRHAISAIDPSVARES